MTHLLFQLWHCKNLMKWWNQGAKVFPFRTKNDMKMVGKQLKEFKMVQLKKIVHKLSMVAMMMTATVVLVVVDSVSHRWVQRPETERKNAK